MDAKCSSKSEELKKKGNECFKTANYDEAIDWYSKAIAACDINNRIQLSVLYCNRGFAHFKLNHFQSSLEDTSHSFELNPTYDKPLYYRFKTYVAIGNMRDALADITAVCVLQKESNKRLIIERDECFVNYCIARSCKFNFKFHKIMASDTCVKEYFNEFYNHPLSDASLTADKLLKLLDDLKNSTGDVNRHAKIALIEGAICQFNLNFDVGEMWLASVANTVQGDKVLQVVSLIQLANIKFHKLCFSKCLSVESAKCVFNIFERALKIDKNNVDIWYHRSRVHLAIKNHEKGLEDLHHCSTLCPSFEPPYCRRFFFLCSEALASNDLIQFNELCNEMREYIKCHPESASMYFTYALILHESGNFLEADKMITKTLSLDSIKFNHHVLKALIAKKLTCNNPCIIMPYYISALEIDPHELITYECLSIFECERGNSSKAIVYIDKGLAMLRNNLDIIRLCIYRELYNSRFKACKTLKLTYLDAFFSTNVCDYYKLFEQIIFAGVPQGLTAYRDCGTTTIRFII